MPVTRDIRREIARGDMKKECCMLSELLALMQALGSMSLRQGGQMALMFKTGSVSVAKRIKELLRAAFQMPVITDIIGQGQFGRRNSIRLTLSAEDSRRLLKRFHVLGTDAAGRDVYLGVPKRTMRRICCRRAFLKGAFLGAGSLSMPGKGYHAEFVLQDEAKARFLKRVLRLEHMESGILPRRDKWVVYLKDADAIERLLASMEAHVAVLELNEKRLMGQVKKQVTRAMNCDHANLKKQLSAAQRQAEAIEHLSKMRGLSSLSKKLEQLAVLRLVNKDLSLEQLGAKMNPPMTKSSVQSAMRRIMTLSEQANQKKPTNLRREDS